ncbi:hypothetical protein [Lacrimispora sp.]|uniref:hypothetical protein n=1 Tax=Lacrimispora sp. TaxID=2719234 RepID=UPI0028AA4760|nr:hypothetical protein [Lacrimispora sp.]
MALTNEDLQAIAALMDEKINPLRTDIQDMKTDINKMSDRIEILEIKQDITSRKIEDLTFRVASLEHYSKKEFTKVNDHIETLIKVLEVKNILPKQA